MEKQKRFNPANENFISFLSAGFNFLTALIKDTELSQMVAR
jgi:hypothetical protein